MSRLPNFLYVGPDKAGSSWLHEVLLKHPDVYLTPAKDLYFFDRYYDRGLAWYAAQFRDARHEAVVGEVCQDYLFHPEAAERIHETLGPVRVMVSLRDPVERAWSSYLYMRKHGIGPDTFGEALRSRPELLEHGRYATGLDRFLRRFPSELVHVALFDDLTRRPAGVPRRRDQVPRHRPAAAGERGPRGPAAGGQRPVRPPRLRWPAAARTGSASATARGSWAASSAPTLVQRALYRPIDRRAVRPDPSDVVAVRDALAGEVAALERTFGLPLRESWGW